MSQTNSQRSAVSPSLARPQRLSAGRRYPWYDSNWLAKYARAKEIIRGQRPQMLQSFESKLSVFRTRPDFEVQRLDRVFSDDVLAEIRRTIATLARSDLELHEAVLFRRFVVHDHPFFNALHRQCVSLVSEAVGEPIEPAYNFLSLYSTMGVCPVHMDAPSAKWTLDLCVEQSAAWPIYFSQVQPWPERDDDSPPLGERWQEEIKESAANRFQSVTLEPGQAVVFSGSSQWHYRDAIPANVGRQYCHLLFFHFIPKGTAELVRPANWARLFDLPELDELAAGPD